MKKLLIVLLLCSPMFANASDCSTTQSSEEILDARDLNTVVPKGMEGAVIIVRQKDGKESIVPIEKYKVVPRKQQLVVTRTKQTDKMVCGPDKNRVSVLAGNGPKEGLDRSNNGTTVEVESRVGAVGGLQYQRLTNATILGKALSVGGQLQTNKSALLNVGIDF